MITVYLLTTIIATAWIIKMILHRKIIIHKTSFTLPLLIFLASQVISTLVSIDTHTSIWGYYSRFHGGLLSTISYLILYYAYTSNMAERINNSIKVILSTALLVSLYGILQHFGIDSHLWVQDVQNRIFSTLGQPNWLAAYLLALIPLSSSLSIKKPIYHLSTTTFFIALLFTKSRSGLLGLAFAWLAFWLLTLLKNKLKHFPYKPFVIINSIFLISVLLIGTPYTPSGSELMDYKGKQSTKIESSKPPQISDLGPPRVESRQRVEAGPPTAQTGGSKSSDIRKVVWRGSLDVWRHYPIFGSGTETFAYSYYNHRPVEHNLLSEWDFLYNKAHNEFLNFLATTGAFGLLSYCLLILWFIIYSLKHLRSSPLISALLAGYLGLSISNFFGFSVVPVALFFFLFPALTIKSKGSKLTSSSESSQISGPKKLTILIVVSIALYLLYSIINLWRADRIFNLGRNHLKANQISTGYQYAVKAVNLSPGEPLFRNLLAETAAKMAVIYHQQTTDPLVASQASTLRDQFILEAINQSDETLRQNKVHLNFHKSKIKIYLLLASIDPKYYQGVLNAMLSTIDLAPTDAKLYYNLGLLYSKINQTGLAEQTLVKTIDLKPNYEAARFALGSLYDQTNRPDLAKIEYEYILKHLNPDNLTVKDKLNSLL